jgi:hypothetical protein
MHDIAIIRDIERDLVAQNVPGPMDFIREAIDISRTARAAVRAIREVDDSVFEAAGIDPKFHKENFIKVIDEIMKSL